MRSPHQLGAAAVVIRATSVPCMWCLWCRSMWRMSWTYQDTAGRQLASWQPFSSCAYRCVVSPRISLAAAHLRMCCYWRLAFSQCLSACAAQAAWHHPCSCSAALDNEGLCCSLCASSAVISLHISGLLDSVEQQHVAITIAEARRSTAPHCKAHRTCLLPCRN
jgi:hypothetical protein